MAISESEDVRRGRPLWLRQRLEHLGPTFVKFGQYLALRSDLLPQSYCDALYGLLDRAAPMPWSEVHGVLVADFGTAYREIFVGLQEEPTASGSIAQVHRCHLRDGTAVALKIRRPNIEARVRRDLQKARLLANLVSAAGVPVVIPPREVVRELAAWMWQEIDFRQELASLISLHRYSLESSIQTIPRPHPLLCTANVLTLQYLVGVRLTDLAAFAPAGVGIDAQALRERGIDIERFAQNLVTASLDQVFRNRFFHADPHPGNLLIMEGNKVGFVDFGLCQSLEETVREGQMRYFSALYRRDTAQMFKALSEILVSTDRTDAESFRRDFLVETDAWTHRRQMVQTGSNRFQDDGEDTPLSQFMIGVMRAANRNHLEVPVRVLSMYRALLTVDTIAGRLGTQASLGSAGRAFFLDQRLEQVLESLTPEQQLVQALQAAELYRQAPGQISDLLAEAAAGTLTLKVEVTESTRSSRSRMAQTRLVVTAILLVALTLLLLRPDLPEIYGLPSSWLVSVIVLLIYGWIVVQWRRLS
jgi:ubiquinone biosynthesis protein